MSSNVQISGNIVRSGAGELDLISDFNNRSDITNFTDQIITIPADSLHEVCGMTNGVTFIALLVEEGHVDLAIIIDSIITVINTSKVLVLTGINADSVQVRNPSESASAKVRIIAGG